MRAALTATFSAAIGQRFGKQAGNSWLRHGGVTARDKDEQGVPKCAAKTAPFRATSMGAERWQPIEEVGRSALLEYLRSRRKGGWTVVGLEQASGATPLHQFSFPAKTLLLLGAEKEGVPPELLAEVDACVEIPQAGLIRSLNVHVSASLVMWEYCRQHPI